MSVLLETSLGDLVVDLHTTECPRACENFLKLCKTYRYHYLTFFSVQKNFLAQTGDPTNSGEGGQSIWSLLPESAPAHSSLPYFRPERSQSLRHAQRGTLSMACRRLKPDDKDSLVAGSQFFVTLADNVDYLDDKHAPFGCIVEGGEPDGTLDRINAAFVDRKTMRPMRDIRIQHVVVLDDPYDDPVGLGAPSRTPSPTPQQLAAIALDAEAPLDEDDKRPIEEVEEERRRRDKNAAALTLEMVGDLPFAEVRPPENILFVCKLNPVTRSEDLELIFSRFGRILSCEVIRDKRTNDSLQYAFIEFDEQKAAEQAYFKMQNVLVDDRRIWVDFSQSVTKLSDGWNTSRSRGKPVKVMHGGAQGSRGRRDGERDSRDGARRSDYDDESRRGNDRRDRSHGDVRRDRYDQDRSYQRPESDRRPRDERRDEDRDRRRDSGRYREPDEKSRYGNGSERRRHHDHDADRSRRQDDRHRYAPRDDRQSSPPSRHR